MADEDDYYDLGAYRRPVTTASADAQRWFDRGLIWSYAFNHEEAARCFRRAAEHDEGCAMAHWGLAYCLGPNYNKPWDFFDAPDLLTTVESTHRAAERAHRLAGGASPVERALVAALRRRYPERPGGGEAEWSVWNLDYAEAMRGVHERFPDDLDVAALYADALMNLTPWRLWDIRTGRPAPGARTLEAQAVLERALFSSPSPAPAPPGEASRPGLAHPGLLHLYIHLMEMSPHPERALPAADHLRGLAPDAGHLRHMPSHLDVLCGDYRRAIAANVAAAAADAKFLRREGAMNFYTLYRAHNLHFRVYAALFAGQSGVALEAAALLERSVPEALLRVASPPMADWLEAFAGVRLHALVRFGRWDDILALPLPRDPALYCVTTATAHYARGVALAALGRVGEAREQRDLFRAAAARVPPSRTLFNNTCAHILAVAGAVLDGEVAYRAGEFDAAFAALRRAARLDDGLPYDEPWGWMQPVRHALGALLLERGRAEEAAAVYAADLGLDGGSLPRAMQHPGNVWALHGYRECLERLGREGEARTVGAQLELAAAAADVEIRSSCFCRLECQGGRGGEEATEGSCAGDGSRL